MLRVSAGRKGSKVSEDIVVPINATKAEINKIVDEKYHLLTIKGKVKEGKGEGEGQGRL